MLPRFRFHLYAAPPLVETGPTLKIADCNFTTFAGVDLSIAQLPIAFEEAAEQLEKFERLHFEYDGSFVWTGVCRVAEGQTTSTRWDAVATVQPHAQGDGVEFPWQVDGMLYDYGGQVQRVELQGCCPLPAWKRLLSVFAPSSDLLLVHWLDEKCFVSAAALDQLWGVVDV